MKHKYIQLFILMTALILVGCKKDEKQFEENLELNNNLQGTWKRVENTPPYSLLVNQVTFIDHTISWFDSTVSIDNNMNGEISTVRGQCPVKFSYRDGIQYYNPYNTTSVYEFSGTTENNLLWVFINEGNKSEIVYYSVSNGIISSGESSQIDPYQSYIGTCFLRFSNNLKTAEFCDPYDRGSLTYNKVN